MVERKIKGKAITLPHPHHDFFPQSVQVAFLHMLGVGRVLCAEMAKVVSLRQDVWHTGEMRRGGIK